ncbi:unnamed protein product, partial [Sphacelaria rigidula]
MQVKAPVLVRAPVLEPLRDPRGPIPCGRDKSNGDNTPMFTTGPWSWVQAGGARLESGWTSVLSRLFLHASNSSKGTAVVLSPNSNTPMAVMVAPGSEWRGVSGEMRNEGVYRGSVRQ